MPGVNSGHRTNRSKTTQRGRRRFLAHMTRHPPICYRIQPWLSPRPSTPPQPHTPPPASPPERIRRRVSLRPIEQAKPPISQSHIGRFGATRHRDQAAPAPAKLQRSPSPNPRPLRHPPRSDQNRRRHCDQRQRIHPRRNPRALMPKAQWPTKPQGANDQPMTNQWLPALGFVVWCFVGHWSLVISVSPNAQRPIPSPPSFIVHHSSFIVSPAPPPNA
jgi:hypothetical protein